jgi:hypothetical protein
MLRKYFQPAVLKLFEKNIDRVFLKGFRSYCTWRELDIHLEIVVYEKWRFRKSRTRRYHWSKEQRYMIDKRWEVASLRSAMVGLAHFCGIKFHPNRFHHATGSFLHVSPKLNSITVPHYSIHAERDDSIKASLPEMIHT